MTIWNVSVGSAPPCIYSKIWKTEHTYYRSTNGRMERALSSDNALMIKNRDYELWLSVNLKRELGRRYSTVTNLFHFAPFCYFLLLC